MCDLLSCPPWAFPPQTQAQTQGPGQPLGPPFIGLDGSPKRRQPFRGTLDTFARLFFPRLIRLVAQNVVRQGGFFAPASSENWGVISGRATFRGISRR
jgi:hypothetical protein